MKPSRNTTYAFTFVAIVISMLFGNLHLYNTRPATNCP